MPIEPADPSVLRILDANFNRAREGLRVMEEYARFVLDDVAGCEAIKTLRHELAAAMATVGGAGGNALLASRDTVSDVGTQISTASESRRGDARDVFIAAAKRLPEALRSIEEYGKTVDAGFARRIEAIRYRAYTLEQRIALRGGRCARFARTRLYVIVTASLCSGDWLDTARAAIDGGADVLQLREKGFEDRELLDRARRMAALCRERGVLFILNDRPDLAALADADGVHLGQTDMSVADARRIVGADRLIGLSTHNPDQLRAAIAEAPDYIAVGPMFPSPTKPQDHVPGPDLLALAAHSTKLPVVPIGGIDEARTVTLLQGGARRVCVCSTVISAPSPRERAACLIQLLPPN